MYLGRKSLAVNTRQERYQLGCLLTWSLLVTQTQGKKIVLQVKSCSSPNESEFVALPVFPAYPCYLTGVRLWHVHWSNASFLPSVWHFLSLSPILTQRNCKRNIFSLPGSNTQGSWHIWGLFWETTGEKKPWGIISKMAICERKACFFNLHFPVIFDLPIYIYLFEFKKEGVLPILKN